MEGFSGARSAVAFDNANSNSIPDPSTLTYEGLFSENYFKLESLTDKDKDLELSQAQVKNPITGELEQYLGLLVKSKHDGVGMRLPIDLCVTVDISGSMRDSMGFNMTRISLAKEACIKLIGLLGKDDHLALNTFNQQSQRIFPLTQGDKLSSQHISKINAITAKGGTTLYKALEHCYQIMKKSTNANRRIIFITDLCDNCNNQPLIDLFNKCAAEAIYVTVIGISYQCSTSLAEVVSHTKGCNYFVAEKPEEIDKYLVNDFKYICFPSSFDVNIEFRSNNLKVVKSIGAGFNVPKEHFDHDKEWQRKNHKDNAGSFKNKMNQFLLYFKRINRKVPMPVLASFCNYLRFNKTTVCEVNTTFPSGLIEKNKDTYIEGSVILLKLKKENTVNEHYVEIDLKFTTLDGKKHVQTYSVRFPNFSSIDEFFSDRSIKNALSLYYYAKWCRILMKGEHGKTKKAMDKYSYKEACNALCQKSAETVRVFLNHNFEEYITKKKEEKRKRVSKLIPFTRSYQCCALCG